MSFEGFFESVVRNLKLEHKRLLCTPRARADLIKNKNSRTIGTSRFLLTMRGYFGRFCERYKKTNKRNRF